MYLFSMAISIVIGSHLLFLNLVAMNKEESIDLISLLTLVRDEKERAEREFAQMSENENITEDENEKANDAPYESNRELVIERERILEIIDLMQNEMNEENLETVYRSIEELIGEKIEEFKRMKGLALIYKKEVERIDATIESLKKAIEGLSSERKMACLAYMGDFYIRVFENLNQARSCFSSIEEIHKKIDSSDSFAFFVAKAYLGVMRWGTDNNFFSKFAFEYFSLIKENGCAYAKALADAVLGQIYFKGGSGVKMDTQLGHRLLTSAINQKANLWASKLAQEFLSPTASPSKTGQINFGGKGRLPTYDDFCFGPVPRFHGGKK